MFAAAIAAFITIFVAEFGDKTQLVSLTMACRYPPLQVLAGAMVALSLVIGLAVLAGGFLAAHVPHTLIAIVSGLIFIIIGIINYRRKDDSEAECSDRRDGFIQTLVMVFAAEFGDKTQLAAMFLVAGLGFPVAVFIGAMLAMLLNHLIAIYLGSRFISRLNPRYLQLGTAALFCLIGLFIILWEAGPLIFS
jgi:Ca2+/H+ antiporter, TMEM165/GDT1 family